MSGRGLCQQSPHTLVRVHHRSALRHLVLLRDCQRSPLRLYIPVLDLLCLDLLCLSVSISAAVGLLKGTIFAATVGLQPSCLTVFAVSLLSYCLRVFVVIANLQICSAFIDGLRYLTPPPATRLPSRTALLMLLTT